MHRSFCLTVFLFLTVCSVGFAQKPDEIDATLNAKAERQWPAPILSLKFKTVLLPKQDGEGMLTVATVKMGETKTTADLLKTFDMLKIVGYALGATMIKGTAIRIAFVNFESPAGKMSVAVALDMAKEMTLERTKPAELQDAARIKKLEKDYLDACASGPITNLLSK